MFVDIGLPGPWWLLQANAPSLWRCIIERAPERHHAQVLPDLDLGSKQVTQPY